MLRLRRTEYSCEADAFTVPVAFRTQVGLVEVNILTIPPQGTSAQHDGAVSPEQD